MKIPAGGGIQLEGIRLPAGTAAQAFRDESRTAVALQFARLGENG